MQVMQSQKVVVLPFHPPLEIIQLDIRSFYVMCWSACRGHDREPRQVHMATSSGGVQLSITVIAQVKAPNRMGCGSPFKPLNELNWSKIAFLSTGVHVLLYLVRRSGRG